MDIHSNRREGSEHVNVPPLCALCHKHIYDGTILKVKGQFWHNSCLQCTICRTVVTGYCHAKGNDVYCRADFIRLFGAKCTGCTKVISPTMCVRVANGNAYHPACFTCMMCKNSVKTGEYFYMKEDGSLLCCNDFQRAIATEKHCYSDSESDESGSDETDERTCINDNQIHILSDELKSNRRPLHNDRLRLSQETGLSPRVIQLWFHNRRFQVKSRRSVVTSEVSSYFQGIPTNEGCVGNALYSGINNSNYWPVQDIHTSLPIGPQTTMKTSTNYQLYCPLDYMVPDSMPPNVDLSCTDICNGEVIPGKQQTGSTKGATQHVTSEPHSRHWRVA